MKRNKKIILNCCLLLDNEYLEVIIAAIELIKQRTNSMLNEHIHVALTDHLMFALTRVTQGHGNEKSIFN